MRRSRTKISLLLALFVMLPFASANAASNNADSGALAVIKGVVRDDGGSPIADATVAIFRKGTSTLLKQVQSAADGSFLARIAPGTYSVLAVANGFIPVTLAEVEVAQSAQLIYGFKLVRAGRGETLPERRLDRNNPKWIRRSATLTRSIYQNRDGEEPAVETTDEDSTASADAESRFAKGRSFAESYVGNSGGETFAGFNFATFLPVAENADLVLAVQTGIGQASPQRVEAKYRIAPNSDHQIRISTSVGKLGRFTPADGRSSNLGQVSASATDEWKVREGMVLVFGLDYARFVGAGSDQNFAPRFGVQYDVDSKTRLRSAFTTQTEDHDWSRAIELENAEVVFREPVAVDDLVIVGGKPVMNRATRFEIGFERVLDNNSSLDANFFADTSYAKGVGISGIPPMSGSPIADFVGNQQGSAQGVSLVYRRRFNGRLSAAAGYSAGHGQKLSAKGIADPRDLFVDGIFQTFFTQVDADFKTGTNVRTVFRLSPDATIFAIDPFKGRLAIYDPSMSVMVTQDLPTLGLPIEAQAILDARNLFDFHSCVSGDEGTLKLNGQGRMLRGGILVRF